MWKICKIQIHHNIIEEPLHVWRTWLGHPSAKRGLLDVCIQAPCTGRRHPVSLPLQHNAVSKCLDRVVVAISLWESPWVLLWVGLLQKRGLHMKAMHPQCYRMSRWGGCHSVWGTPMEIMELQMLIRDWGHKGPIIRHQRPIHFWSMSLLFIIDFDENLNPETSPDWWSCFGCFELSTKGASVA